MVFLGTGLGAVCTLSYLSSFPGAPYWMQRGIIPYLKVGKGRRATVLFKWADIEAHLKANYGVGTN